MKRSSLKYDHLKFQELLSDSCFSREAQSLKRMEFGVMVDEIWFAICEPVYQLVYVDAGAEDEKR